MMTRHTCHRTAIASVVAFLSLALLISAARAVDSAVIAAQKSRVAVIEKVAPAVVAIFSAGGNGGGSGVLISPEGFALTNFHVTRGAGDFMKCGLNNGLLYDAVIVGIDPTGDVALVKLLGRNDFPHVKLGDSDKLKVGAWTYAMGNPFLLATDFKPTVTYGIVSGMHRYQYPAGTFLEYTDCIQVDTSINPGNSGGPLFNADGELVGINGRGSFEKRGRVNSGAGYAISINQIKHFMGHLRSGRVVDHATLGATVETLNDGSVVVTGILEEAEAFRRGLQAGDEIVSFAGRSIRSVNQFKNILGIYPKGWKLPLVYRHDDRKRETYVRLRALHRKSELTPKKKKPQPRPQNPDKKKPGDDKPDGKKPGDKKPQPIPIPHGRPPKAKPPEKYKHMLVKKDGFANYFFNQLEEKRTLKGIERLGDFSGVAGVWKLYGTAGNGDAVEIGLSDSILAMEIGEKPFVQELENDLVDEPPGSGGLLLAMNHLRLLLTKGRRPFTEFYYLGTEPLDGRGEMVDVIVSVLTGVETRWYFNQSTGNFVGFDTSLTEDVDACEIRLGEFTEFDGRQFPKRIIVRNGSREFVTFQVERLELRPGEKSNEKNNTK